MWGAEEERRVRGRSGNVELMVLDLGIQSLVVEVK